MGLRSDWKLPREHGAWGMLYVPFFAGTLAAGRFSWAVLPLALAVTCFFIAREPLLAWWRARSWGRDPGKSGRMAALYLAGAASFGAPITVRFPGLAAVAAVGFALLALNTHLGARREDRTIGAEVLAIVGLTLTAPAAHYVSAGAWRVEALPLWLLSVAYFGSSVLYVRLRVFSAHPRKIDQARRIRRWCAMYHALLPMALLAVGPWFLAAFAPVLVWVCRRRTRWATRWPTGNYTGATSSRGTSSSSASCRASW